MKEQLRQILESLNITGETANTVEIGIAFLLLVILVAVGQLLAVVIVKPLVANGLHRALRRFGSFDSELRFGSRVAHLIPVLTAYLATDFLLKDYPLFAGFMARLIMSIFVFVCVGILNGGLDLFRDIYSSLKRTANKPIQGYIDGIKIVIHVMGIIFIVAFLTDRSPWGVLSVLGGLTAVVLLIFKDTILGFIASMQLSAYDMVRVGDWIEMPSYGANGDVIDVTIHTVKVRNWDKTVATIPTYALVSNSFKNWRGMQESGGRRIKRSLFIDVNSIRFCDDRLIQRFAGISLIRDYVSSRQREIETDNAGKQHEASIPVNGRRQTNIGVFRAYVTAYLKAHPKIHQQMTFLVRHLQPTAQGLPIEIYVFSREQAWADYEAIQADIFDHMLAAAAHFDLKIFQYPSGADLRSLKASNDTGEGQLYKEEHPE